MNQCIVVQAATRTNTPQTTQAQPPPSVEQGRRSAAGGASRSARGSGRRVVADAGAGIEAGRLRQLQPEMEIVEAVDQQRLAVAQEPVAVGLALRPVAAVVEADRPDRAADADRRAEPHHAYDRAISGIRSCGGSGGGGSRPNGRRKASPPTVARKISEGAPAEGQRPEDQRAAEHEARSTASAADPRRPRPRPALARSRPVSELTLNAPAAAPPASLIRLPLAAPFAEHPEFAGCHLTAFAALRHSAEFEIAIAKGDCPISSFVE